MASSSRRDCSVQTLSSSGTGLALLINDIQEIKSKTKVNASIAGTPCTCSTTHKPVLEPRDTYNEPAMPPRSSKSPARRLLAKYEPHQLQEVNDEIELGWDCGICLETAEDPCVTRCGHLYCRAHLHHWLASHPTCPVCKAVCTPKQDVVPIFSRGRTSPTSSPIVSSRASPAPPDIYYSYSDQPIDAATNVLLTSNDSLNTSVSNRADGEGYHPENDMPLRPLTPSPSPGQSTVQRYPHPLAMSHALAHYLGVALRVIGVAILLSVLLR